MLNVTVNGTDEGSDCVGGAVPGSNLHQLFPAALCELRCLSQRLHLQRRAKQPEEDLFLLSAETAAACRREGRTNTRTTWQNGQKVVICLVQTFGAPSC